CSWRGSTRGWSPTRWDTRTLRSRCGSTRMLDLLRLGGLMET
ncbi:MAG: hypothetical protein AVDCRST_MAG22-920, partial [uncultured Rubrobacteraceae bacterium]